MKQFSGATGREVETKRRITNGEEMMMMRARQGKMTLMVRWIVMMVMIRVSGREIMMLTREQRERARMTK